MLFQTIGPAVESGAGIAFEYVSPAGNESTTFVGSRVTFPSLVIVMLNSTMLPGNNWTGD